MISLSHYLVLGAILFAIAVIGIFLNRKNMIVLLMAIELMLLAVNLNFIAFSAYAPGPSILGVTGQAVAVVLVGLAATEVAVGLAIVLALNRVRGSVDVAKAMDLKL